MIFNLTLIVVMNIFWCLSWKIVTSEDMPLHSLFLYAEKKYKNGSKIWDGLVLCPWCIPNIHGFFIVWPAAFALKIIPFVFNYKYLIVYPFMLCAASFMTGFIWNIYLWIVANRNAADHSSRYYDNAQKFYYNANKQLKEEKNNG